MSGVIPETVDEHATAIRAIMNDDGYIPKYVELFRDLNRDIKSIRLGLGNRPGTTNVYIYLFPGGENPGKLEVSMKHGKYLPAKEVFGEQKQYFLRMFYNRILSRRSFEEEFRELFVGKEDSMSFDADDVLKIIRDDLTEVPDYLYEGEVNRIPYLMTVILFGAILIILHWIGLEILLGIRVLFVSSVLIYLFEQTIDWRDRYFFRNLFQKLKKTVNLLRKSGA